MKKRFLLGLLVCLSLLGSLVSCEKSNTNVTSDKEAEFQKVVTPYVNNTVVTTYSAMADAGMVLLDQCEQILDKVEKGEGYADLMVQADASWRSMRKHW